MTTDCTSEWYAGLTCDHLYADCPNRKRGEAELRRVGWWFKGDDLRVHGTDVCGAVRPPPQPQLPPGGIVTYALTPRQDRLRVLRARRDQLDALIRRLEEAERQDGDGPRPVAQCGTETGYDRHRRLGEEADEACKNAKREAERARYTHRKAQRQARLGRAS